MTVVCYFLLPLAQEYDLSQASSLCPGQIQGAEQRALAGPPRDARLPFPWSRDGDQGVIPARAGLPCRGFPCRGAERGCPWRLLPAGRARMGAGAARLPSFDVLLGCFQRRSLLDPPLWHLNCDKSLNECPSARQRGEQRLESARFIDKTRAERTAMPLCECIQASAAGWPPPNSAAPALCRLIGAAGKLPLRTRSGVLNLLC